RVTIAFYRSGSSIFVVFARNHRLDAKLDEVVVNPVGSVTFVASEFRRIDDRNVILIDNVYLFEQRRQGLVVMRLTRRKVHMQWMSVTIAEQMDFRGKTATGTP